MSPSRHDSCDPQSTRRSFPCSQSAERRLLRHGRQTARESNLPEVTTVRSQAQYHQASSNTPSKCAVLPLDPLGMGGFLHKYVEHASRSSEICFWLYLAGLCGCCPLSSQNEAEVHVSQTSDPTCVKSVHWGAYFLSTIVPPALQNLTPDTVCGELNLDRFAHSLFPGLFEPSELGPRPFLSSLPRFVDVLHRLFLF
jgi:hypothetical protein